MPASTYTGYREEDFATPYAKFYNETIEPLSPDIQESLAKSPYFPGTMTSLYEVATMMDKGYAEIENGYSIEKDHSACIAALTKMPGVNPVMWDWWFSWH